MHVYNDYCSDYCRVISYQCSPLADADSILYSLVVNLLAGSPVEVCSEILFPFLNLIADCGSALLVS